MTEEQKLAMKQGREEAKNKVANLEHSLNDFKSTTEDKLTKIVGVLETLVNQNKEPERKVMMATETSQTTSQGDVSNVPSNEEVIHNLNLISQEYQNRFEKYFDPIDGFKGMLKGVNFKIEVPLKLSNAQDAHKTFYKHDIRHKVLDSHDIEGSLEKYCKLVASNLNYNRKIMLKI